MGRLAGFKYKDVARKLRNLVSGSIAKPAAATKSGAIRTAAGQPWFDILCPIAEGTLRAILREGEIDVEEFLRA